MGSTSKWAIVIFLILQSGKLFTQNPSLNMTLLGQWHDPSLPLIGGQRYSDIWGYTAGGQEYAIMGSLGKIHFFNVTEPSNIHEIANFTINPNSNSYWRDFKTYGHYAYAVADQGGTAEGLVIFDLSGLPNTVTQVNQITTDFVRAHNIYIDTQHGKLYVAGSNTVSNGLIIYNLAADPVNPPPPATPVLSGGYVHDIHVRNNIGFASQGNNGMRVFNFSNPNVPVFLGSLTGYIDNGYNHSSWLTDDGNYLVFCDENHGRTVKMTNVQNYSTMFVTDTFKSALLAPAFTNSIAHNPFIKEDNVFVSYYHDGIQVFSLIDPENVVKVAYFDTDPAAQSYSGFRGSWGNYPYLPSGNIIASDMINGLFVLRLEPIFLPVDILSFQATAQKDGILIKGDLLDVPPGSMIKVIANQSGQQVGKTISITDQDPLRFTFGILDVNPVKGYNYYRLLIELPDGEVNQSGLVAAHWQTEKSTGVYPSLVKAGQSLQIIPGTNSGNLRIEITSMQGYQVCFYNLEVTDTNTPLQIELPQGLSGGFYNVTFLSGQTTVVESFRIFIQD